MTRTRNVVFGKACVDCPYRGIVKNNAWIHHRVAGLALRRMITLGLTWHEGSWALPAS